MRTSIIIAGGRDFTNLALLKASLLAVCKQHSITSLEIVCGGANGADNAGRMVGIAAKIPVKMMWADWATYGKSAGYRRNVEMGEYADRAIIFWDGKSKGSKHMIDIMEKLDKPYTVIPY